MFDFLKSKILRNVVVVLVVILTFALFAWYAVTHPKLVDTLLQINPVILTLLAIAYCFTIAANSVILHYSLAYVRRSTPLLDNILLTGYSSIVNFFGPLQSGPGFRAVYLKRKYNIEIKKFLVATFAFYLFFLMINASIIFTSSFIELPSLRLTLALSLIVAIVLGFPIIKLIRRTRYGKLFFENARLNDKNFWLIGLGALALAIAVFFVFLIELHQVNPAIQAWQIVVYTAAANLSLFVSLTPGAIGFRESFLLLSQQLHHISTNNIVAASIIDRAFYALFLLVLFIALLVIKKCTKLTIFSKNITNQS